MYQRIRSRIETANTRTLIVATAILFLLFLVLTIGFGMQIDQMLGRAATLLLIAIVWAAILAVGEAAKKKVA